MLTAIADALFPTSCPGCGARAAPVCADCLAQVRAAGPMPPPAGIEHWAAPFAYEGVVRELVARVKYRDQRHALTWLASRAAAAARVGLPPPDLVTWAPTTAAHRKARGFDHAATIARKVAAELGVACRPLLVRVGGAAQTGRPARERRDGPRFELARPAPLARLDQISRVLVVDDVATTGATLRGAARPIRAGGGVVVDALTLARTPPPT